MPFFLGPRRVFGQVIAARSNPVEQRLLRRRDLDHVVMVRDFGLFQVRKLLGLFLRNVLGVAAEHGGEFRHVHEFRKAGLGLEGHAIGRVFELGDGGGEVGRPVVKATNAGRLPANKVCCPRCSPSI